MAVLELEESGHRRSPIDGAGGAGGAATDGRPFVGSGPAAPTPPAPVPVPRHLQDDALILAAYRLELDGYYAEVKRYASQEPDEVLISISGIGARLTEMRADLIRSTSQRASNLRTKEVEPLMDQLDNQFKIHSRLQSIREFDLKIAGGAPS